MTSKYSLRWHHLQLAEDLLGGTRQHGAYQPCEAVGGRGEHVERHRPEDEELEAEGDGEGA